jgi:hypothetical protein
MKQEFRLLAAIIRDLTPEDYSYEPETGTRKAKKSDYSQVNIIPVSDPNAATMAQKVVQYQAVFQMAQSAPQLYDLAYLHRQMIETLGVKNAAKIVPMPDDMKPVDPVSENMAILTGKPVKAFIVQDHDAHIATHMAMMQDPKIAAMIGQSPMAQQMQAAVMAHVAEHLAFAYRAGIERQLGAALPPPPDKDNENLLSPALEAQLAPLVAQAAQQLLAQNQAQAAQQQVQQQMQDPLIQMQQQELAIKQAEVSRKATKDQADTIIREKELAIREQEVINKTHTEGVRIGLDAAKHRDQMSRPQPVRKTQ